MKQLVPDENEVEQAEVSLEEFMSDIHSYTSLKQHQLPQCILIDSNENNILEKIVSYFISVCTR